MKNLERKGKFPSIARTIGATILMISFSLMTTAQEISKLGMLAMANEVKTNWPNIDITYYTGDFYPEIKGKVKSIGGTDITYYTGDFYPEIKGKVKSIGSIEITYYTGNFYPEIKGKIKSIGQTEISYYTGDFYPEIKGKVQSIGNFSLTYYTGDFYPELKGKVKSTTNHLPKDVMALFAQVLLLNED